MKGTVSFSVKGAYCPHMNRGYHLAVAPLDPKSFAPGSRSRTPQPPDEATAGLYPGPGRDEQPL